MQEQLKPKWRNGVGMMLMLLAILLWCIAVLLLSPLVARLPFLIEMLFYAVAGIGWVFPMRPLLMWMETGAWRRQR